MIQFNTMNKRSRTTGSNTNARRWVYLVECSIRSGQIRPRQTRIPETKFAKRFPKQDLIMTRSHAMDVDAHVISIFPNLNIVLTLKRVDECPRRCARRAPGMWDFRCHCFDGSIISLCRPFNFHFFFFQSFLSCFLKFPLNRNDFFLFV